MRFLHIRSPGVRALCAASLASTIGMALPDVASPGAALSATRPHLLAVHTFVVNSHNDLGATNPASGHCSTTVGSCTLRAAIEVANALVVPVVVKLSAGTYALSLGSLDVSDPYGVTINGKSSGATTVAGPGADRVFRVGNAKDFGGTSTHGGRLVLNDLAVTNGFAQLTSVPVDLGGGVYVGEVNDSFSATNVRFQNDRAGSATLDDGRGGAIYNTGTTILTNCTFLGNVATYGGGAIFQRNMFLTVDNSTFDGNHASPDSGSHSGYGGAVNTDASTQIFNSSFKNNTATGIGSGNAYGGAIYAGEVTTMSRDTFVGNIATGGVTGNGYGGALDNSYSVGDLTGLTFKNNTALGTSAFGGAMYNVAQAALTGATFSGNKASGTSSGSGGAIYNESQYTSLTIERSLFNRNKASSGTELVHQGGGAIFDSAGARISSSIFTNNVAQHGDGGAVWNHGDGDAIYNSTFAGNSATGGSYGSESYAGYGGALYLWDTSVVSDSAIFGNHASQGGGGLYSDDANIVNDTIIKSNTANEGGGVYLDWLITGFRDTIIDNSAVGVGASGGGIFVANTPNIGFSLSGSVVAGNIGPLGAGIEMGRVGALFGGSGVLSGSFVGGNETASGAPKECHYGAPAYPIGSGNLGNVAGNTSCNLSGASDRQGAGMQGYWFVTSAGHVAAKQGVALGGAGSTSAIALGPGNTGYLTVAPNGAVKAHGSATAHGSAVGKLAGGTAVALLTTLDRQGYWVVSSTGAVVPFGDAQSFGERLGAHVVAAERTVDARGYWLLTSTGVVMTFGDARNFGHHAGTVRIAATPDGQGYWLVTATGVVFHYGDAKAFGSVAASGVIGIASSPDGRGYLVFTKSGKAFARGDAHSSGAMSGAFSAVAAS